MSNMNYNANKKAIDEFRKELLDMIDDIKEIDKKILNQAVNEGVAYAKRRTPVGLHPNPVVFTIKNGPKVGKIVSFKIHNPITGGKLRENWHKLPTKRTANGLKTEMVNTMEYASFWNYGHQIVTKKGGPTKGFVKGTYVLEKTQLYVTKRVMDLFKKEVEAVQHRHD